MKGLEEKIKRNISPVSLIIGGLVGFMDAVITPDKGLFNQDPSLLQYFIFGAGVVGVNYLIDYEDKKTKIANYMND